MATEKKQYNFAETLIVAEVIHSESSATPRSLRAESEFAKLTGVIASAKEQVRLDEFGARHSVPWRGPRGLVAMWRIHQIQYDADDDSIKVTSSWGLYALSWGCLFIAVMLLFYSGAILWKYPLFSEEGIFAALSATGFSVIAYFLVVYFIFPVHTALKLVKGHKSSICAN